MFLGRHQELKVLEDKYNSNRFEMVVIYGRRRIGKTSLIEQFLKNHHALRFTARQQTDRMILRSFSQTVTRYFGLPSKMEFQDWESAFDFLVKMAQENQEEKFILSFDEFPYAALVSDGLPSILQIAIDHGFLQTNTLLILSGSNQGFMENNVLGGKSPLYGRRTGQIRLRPFDCEEAMEFLPKASAEDCVRYYATFGGTPYYLNQIDPDKTFEQNVEDLCFNISGLLYEEPMMLLREELRNPATFDSVLQAISSGANTFSLIEDRTEIDGNSVGYYLRVLADLRLIEKQVPFGENKNTSRNGRFKIKDPFFAFWYQFVAPAVPMIESGEGHRVVTDMLNSPAFATYLGSQFEEICTLWALHHSEKEFSINPTAFGKWWGNNPHLKEQTDIDLVIANKLRKELLIGECKWKNRLNETEMVNSLKERVGLIGGYKSTKLAFFTKKRVNDKILERYANDPDMRFVCAEDMFERPLYR